MQDEIVNIEPGISIKTDGTIIIDYEPWSYPKEVILEEENACR